MMGNTHPTPSAEAPAESIPSDLPRIGTAGIVVLALLFVAMLAGLFVLGYLPHQRLQTDLRAETDRANGSKPLVTAAIPKRQQQATQLVLPADIESFQQTLVYSRTSGYLKKLLVDIGDRVQAGQLIAEIDTPEIDAQLNQARAALQQAEANVEKAQIDLELGRTTFDRYQETLKSGGVAQQQFDEKHTQWRQAGASLSVARANLGAAQAEVKRLEVLQGFEKVIAPFSGVISTRNYDIGALLASSVLGSGKELFQIDQTDPLRVFVSVPQAYATTVQTGQKAELLVRNYPGRSFEGAVMRSAGSIDPTTRTLRVQINVSNRENLLFAGMYGQIRFHIMQKQPPLLVPTNALVYNADGLSLAVVKAERVHFQKIAAGRDFGTEIEVLDGLTDNDLVIANPGEQITEGSEVEVLPVVQAEASTSRPAPPGTAGK
jgi:RND family efflux transporter MFP subunit